VGDASGLLDLGPEEERLLPLGRGDESISCERVLSTSLRKTLPRLVFLLAQEFCADVRPSGVFARRALPRLRADPSGFSEPLSMLSAASPRLDGLPSPMAMMSQMMMS
jgi:hypothetical protein